MAAWSYSHMFAGKVPGSERHESCFSVNRKAAQLADAAIGQRHKCDSWRPRCPFEAATGANQGMAGLSECTEVVLGAQRLRQSRLGCCSSSLDAQAVRARQIWTLGRALFPIVWSPSHTGFVRNFHQIDVLVCCHPNFLSAPERQTRSCCVPVPIAALRLGPYRHGHCPLLYLFITLLLRLCLNADGADNQIYIGGFLAGVAYLIVTRVTGFQTVRTLLPPDAPREERATAEMRRLLLGFMAPMLVLQFAATEQVFLPACIDVRQQPSSFDCYALPDVSADVRKAGEIFNPLFVANCSDPATNGTGVDGRLPLGRYACFSVVGQTLTNWLDACGIAYGTMEVLMILFGWTLQLLDFVRHERVRSALRLLLLLIGITGVVMTFVDFLVLLSYIGNLADFFVWLDLSGMFVALGLYGKYW